VVDASPLIYLAKLDALDVFDGAGVGPLVPEPVFEEAAKPALRYRHADAIRIEQAATEGQLEIVTATGAERGAADGLAARIPQMHRGECEVLAIASARGVPAVIHEGRARTIARILGIQLLDVTELLFRGTGNDGLLEARIREFAGLVNMRLGNTEALLELVRQRRLR
jgi:predicted nucleic acid-binding protein